MWLWLLLNIHCIVMTGGPVVISPPAILFVMTFLWFWFVWSFIITTLAARIWQQEPPSSPSNYKQETEERFDMIKTDSRIQLIRFYIWKSIFIKIYLVLSELLCFRLQLQLIIVEVFNAQTKKDKVLVWTIYIYIIDNIMKNETLIFYGEYEL